MVIDQRGNALSQPTNDIKNLEKHTDFLRNLARSSLRAEDVDDLVQDCLLVGLEESPRDSHSTFSWFRTVLTRRIAHDYRQKKRRRRREEDWAPKESQPSALDDVEHRAALKSVTDAVMALSPELYDMVRLRYFDTMRISQIAQLRGLSSRTVKYRLERALCDLRKSLDKKTSGRRALLLLAGITSERVLNLGWMLAMKKTITVVLLAIVSISWVVWNEPDTAESELEVGTIETQRTGSEKPRRRERNSSESAPSAQHPIEDDRVIDRQRDIFGRVVDVHGNPIEGAFVESRIFPWRRLSVLSPRSAEFLICDEAKTTRSGSFSLRHKRGDVVDLRVEKAGFSALILTRRVAGEKIDIVLHTACTLKLSVRSDDGIPLAGAHIVTWRDEKESASRAQFDLRRGKTDSQGVLILNDLSPGPLRLRVSHRSHLSSQLKTVVIVDGAANEHVVQLHGAGSLRGRVTARDTGAPIIGAKVTVSSGDAAVYTDAEGYYLRPGFPMGKGSWRGIQVVAKGFMRATRTLQFSTDDCDFALEKGDSVIGSCVDQNGLPIVDVHVSMIASAIKRHGQVIDVGSATTSKQGSFRIDDLSRSLPHTLIFVAPGFGRRHLDFDPFPGDAAGKIDLGVIELGPGLRVSGTVTRDDGTPIANAHVVLRGSNADRSSRRGLGVGPAQVDYGESEKRRTDDLGRFCFSDLMPGTYVLETSVFGVIPQEQPLVLASEDQDGVEVIVSPPMPFVVNVINESGEVVPDVFIALWHGQERIGARRTDEKGQVSFAGAPVGELTVKVSTSSLEPSYAPVDPITLTAKDRSHIVVLDRSVEVAGRVIGENGEGIENLVVVAHLQSGGQREVFTKAEGEFSFKLLPGSRVDLEVTGKEMKRLTAIMATIKQGPNRGHLDNITAPSNGLLLRVEKGQTDLELTVVVRDAGGQLVEGAWVYASPVTGLKPRITDSEGRVKFENLSKISLHLQALAPANAMGEFYSSAPMTVIPANQKVELSLRPIFELNGRVELTDGTPAGTFLVEAYVGELEHFRTYTDANGQFTMHLADGLSYTIKSSSQDRTIIGQKKAVRRGPITIQVRKK